MERQPFETPTDESWKEIVLTTAPKVVEVLGDEGEPWLVRLLGWEREGKIDRHVARNLICNVASKYERNAISTGSGE